MTTLSPDAQAQRISALAREADQATAAGNPAQAARYWQQLLTLSPAQPQAMTRLAQCHLALGDIDGARGVLSEVLALTPAWPWRMP